MCPGRKLSRVCGSLTMNSSVEILLNILHASLGSLSLSISISGTYLALLPRFFTLCLYVSSGDIRRIVLRSLGSVGYYCLQI
jgi:hypothetical protein